MRLAEVQAHVVSMEELLRIVGAMRSLAGMRLHEALRTLKDVREYGQMMADAVHGALAMSLDETDGVAEMPQSGAGRVRVLCTSEHGFVGAFNERLLQTVDIDFHPADTLLVLGSRGAALACERRLRVSWQCAMATRLASLPGVVQQTQLQLYRLIAAGRVRGAEVVFARLQGRAGTVVERRQLFPLDLPVRSKASAALPPLHHLPAPLLLEKLTGEYILAQLSEALVESLASENAARFAAMETAHDNVSRRLDQLRQDASQARQVEMTCSQVSVPRQG